MGNHLTEESLWAAAVAGRLRLIQANSADESPEARQSYLAEEIERALKDVVPSKRKVHLQALAEKFPVWQVAAPLPVAAAQAKAQIIEDTPEIRLQSLLEAVPGLSPDQRKAFGDKLKQSGLVEAEATGGLPEAPAELVKALALTPDQSISADRALKLLAALVQLSLTLDQLVWNLWKQLAPKSVIRREPGAVSDLRMMTSRYITGDGEVSTQQVTQLLDQSRKLVAGLLMAIGGVGRSYARKNAERFSPDAIRDLAEMTKGWAGIDKRCWDKYIELFREFASEPAIEKEIQDAIGKYAEEVMRGRVANPTG